MNTSKLERFAKTARNILLDGVERKIRYWGFDEKGNSSEQPVAIQGGYIFRGQVYDNPAVPQQWLSLQTAIHSTSFQEIIEKASYVWFNRIVAIKILSKNGYEPAMIDYQDEKVLTPQILVKARRGQYQYLNDNEKSRLNTVISDYSNELRAFGILLIGYCHNNILLSKVFGLIDDYTELLLPDDILSEKGFLNLLNTSDAITDEDYGQVELIGWLYQFYISDKKDEVFKAFKANKKAEARDIPAATQIFTPNWIVKYMVQNTVGRIWLDHKPGSPIRVKMRYLVDSPDADNLTTITSSLISEVANLKLLDPASGSGHILVEGFDLLFDMYLEEYYSSSEAVESILSNNLFGLDIDLRAAQLARFAILLKAASKYPEILKKGIMPQVYAMPEPCEFTRQEVLDFLGNDGAAYEKHLSSVLDLMQQAQNLGSIMRFDLPVEVRSYIVNRFKELQQKSSLSFYEQAVLTRILPFVKVFTILSQEYETLAANPPYMGSGNMNHILKSYVFEKYPISRSDLFSVFMDVSINLLQPNGLYGMINQNNWMFLSSYNALREHIIRNQTICSMLHLGARAFEELGGEVVQSTLFVVRKSQPKNVYGTYFRLIDYRSTEEKRVAFIDKKNIYINIYQSNFLLIQDYPIVYWISDNLLNTINKESKLVDFADPRSGISTGDNERFYRFWFEVDFAKLLLDGNESMTTEENELLIDKKWVATIRGGEKKKWYGNQDCVLNLANNAFEIRNSGNNFRLRTTKYYFRHGITWSRLGSDSISFRVKTENVNFGENSPCLFPKQDSIRLLAFLNSKVVRYILSFINPTLSYQIIDLQRIPIKNNIFTNEKINDLTQQSIKIAKSYWDSSELSWDFQIQNLLNHRDINLEQSFHTWMVQTSIDFFQLHSNEHELNYIFINIYGLEDELTPEILLKDITILQDELDYNTLEKFQPPYTGQLVPVKKDVVLQQLISYTIGCFMGRYRLDKPGLQIAYPNPSSDEIAPYFVPSPLHSETCKMVQFEIDDDAIIPIMGNNGVFTDDALIRIKAFIELVWGEETLSQNLNFLQQSLNKDVEDYLVKDFWKYHCRMYSKRPIYWLFASPRGAFQVLVYMHRMNKFTPDKIRTKYLLRHIQYLRNESERMSSQSSTLSRDEERRLEKLIKDLKECEEYDILLKEIASRQIEFDLDDGVVKNYSLFKGVVAEIK